MLTFHTILADCEAGNGEAWRAFLSDYTSLLIQMASVSVGNREEAASAWRQLLPELCAEDFKGLRALEHQSERLLLAGLRSLLLDRALAGIVRASETAPCAKLTDETVRTLIQDLPILHQELLFLKMAGYSDRTLERMYRVSPAVARKAWERLRGQWPINLEGETDQCPSPEAWLQFDRDIRHAQTEFCPDVRLFIRIQDGQVSWTEKEPAEKHVSECLHCLEAWTALQEISYWKVAAPRSSTEAVENLLSLLPVGLKSRQSKSFFRRVFG